VSRIVYKNSLMHQYGSGGGVQPLRRSAAYKCQVGHVFFFAKGHSMRGTSKPLFLVIAAVVGLATASLLDVQSSAAADDSSFTSQSVPASMGVGTRVFVSLTFLNTGTTTWTPAGGYLLGAPDPNIGAAWEVSSVALPSAVAAGTRVTFTFRVTAPQTPGTYNFQWQMESGTRFFGATSTNVAVKVIASRSGSLTGPRNSHRGEQIASVSSMFRAG